MPANKKTIKQNKSALSPQLTKEYKTFLSELKSKIVNARFKAALAVNQEVIKLYWYIGHQIIEKQKVASWGDKLIETLSNDLHNLFPETSGFSTTGLKRMRLFAENYTEIEFGAQAVPQLPWGQIQENQLMSKNHNLKSRCAWVTSDPIYIEYHDNEWGVPIYDDRLLFEFLILEGAQAGLSWITILKRRDNYRASFDNFDAKKIVHYDEKKYQQLLNNPGIIRNRLKIQSVITNAEAYLKVKKEFGSFSNYIWQFIGGKPIENHWANHSKIPTTTLQSDAMSKDLKKRGFKFVGSTICYAFMQAVGMVNDHIVDCFKYKN